MRGEFRDHISSVSDMATASGFFDIQDDSAFFGIVLRTLDSFQSTTAKKPEDLLLLVLGLAHLREWIAPGYKRNDKRKTRAEQFAAMLFENPDYQTVLLLANHVKHQRRRSLPETQASTFVAMIDDRDTPIDSWGLFDQGPASSYQYGDRDIETILISVAALYREQWFSSPTEG